MNVLILTGRFGMGHLSAAQALQEQLQQDGHQADIVDLFEYALPDAAPAMYRAFNLLVTFGGAFYNLYHVITANNSGGLTAWRKRRTPPPGRSVCKSTSSGTKRRA